MADPWREMAAAMGTAIDAVTDSGVVVVGHVGGIDTWSDFLDQFSVVIGGEKMVAGFRIIEPAGAAVTTTSESVNSGLVSDTFQFQIEGFRMTGESPQASQSAFRDVLWAVKKVLDAMYTFTVTDTAIERVDSWPASQARVMPMLFGQVECWGASLTKTARALRSVTLV